MNCNQTSKSSSMHEYLNRCHLRTLKHFPQMYNDKCFQSEAMGYEEECLDDFGASTWKNKTSIQSKFRHSERENYCFPYKKSLKLLKASKRFRRKCHFNTENDDKLHELVYLNQLADTVITSDSTTGIGATTNMDKRISKLFDEIHYEIVKAKRKYAKNIANTFKLHTPHVLCVFIYLFIIYFDRSPRHFARCAAIINRFIRFRLCTMLSDAMEAGGYTMWPHILHGKLENRTMEIYLNL